MFGNCKNKHPLFTISSTLLVDGSSLVIIWTFILFSSIFLDYKLQHILYYPCSVSSTVSWLCYVIFVLWRGIKLHYIHPSLPYYLLAAHRKTMTFSNVLHPSTSGVIYFYRCESLQYQFYSLPLRFLTQADNNLVFYNHNHFSSSLCQSEAVATRDMCIAVTTLFGF